MMTQEERDAQDALTLQKKIVEAPRKLRDEKLYDDLDIGGFKITPDDLTQQRIMAARIIAKEDETYTVNWILCGEFKDAVERFDVMAGKCKAQAYFQICVRACPDTAQRGFKGSCLSPEPVINLANTVKADTSIGYTEDLQPFRYVHINESSIGREDSP